MKLLFLVYKDKQKTDNGLFQKNPHLHNGRHAGKSQGRGGLTGLEIQRGGGALNLKIHPWG